MRLISRHPRSPRTPLSGYHLFRMLPGHSCPQPVIRQGLGRGYHDLAIAGNLRERDSQKTSAKARFLVPPSYQKRQNRGLPVTRHRSHPAVVCVASFRPLKTIPGADSIIFHPGPVFGVHFNHPARYCYSIHMSMNLCAQFCSGRDLRRCLSPQASAPQPLAASRCAELFLPTRRRVTSLVSADDAGRHQESAGGGKILVWTTIVLTSIPPMPTVAGMATSPPKLARNSTMRFASYSPVIVIGGGPAGSTAATLIAKGGKRCSSSNASTSRGSTSANR